MIGPQRTDTAPTPSELTVGVEAVDRGRNSRSEFQLDLDREPETIVRDLLQRLANAVGGGKFSLELDFQAHGVRFVVKGGRRNGVAATDPLPLPADVVDYLIGAAATGQLSELR